MKFVIPVHLLSLKTKSTIILLILKGNNLKKIKINFTKIPCNVDLIYSSFKIAIENLTKI